MIDYPSPNKSLRLPFDLIELIIMHATVGNARSSLAWLANPMSRVSIHYLIDKGGTVYRMVPEDWIAWHTGRAFWQGRVDLNRISLGIELENRNDGRDPYPVAQVDAAVALVQDICARHPIHRESILTHAMVARPIGRKTDPAGFSLAAFVAAVFGPTPALRFRVAVQVANVRQGADIAFPVAGTMRRGEILVADKVLDGAVVSGDRRWAHRADGLGFVHLSLLEPLA